MADATVAQEGDPVYKIYSAPRSAALGVRAMLEIIGAPYEVSEVDISAEGPRDPELLRINPNGWVPALVFDDRAMYEAAAITIFLCDRHPQAGLAPAPEDPLRAPFLQWLVYMAGTLQPVYQSFYYTFRWASREEDYASVRTRAGTRLAEVWQVLDDALEPGPWLLGERFSACDVYLYMLSTWLADEHPAITDFPNAARCAEQVAAIPAVARVFD